MFLHILRFIYFSETSDTDSASHISSLSRFKIQDSSPAVLLRVSDPEQFSSSSTPGSKSRIVLQSSTPGSGSRIILQQFYSRSQIQDISPAVLLQVPDLIYFSSSSTSVFRSRIGLQQFYPRFQIQDSSPAALPQVPDLGQFSSSSTPGSRSSVSFPAVLLRVPDPG